MANYFIVNTIHGDLSPDVVLAINKYIKKKAEEKFFAIDHGTMDTEGMHVVESCWTGK